MATYNVGDQLKLSAEFRDQAGNLADPTTVTLKITKPGGTVITRTVGNGVTKDAVGKYSSLFSIDKFGNFAYRWEGTGAVEAAGEARFCANQPA